MPPLIAFAGALGGLAVVRWAYKTAQRINRELEEARLARMAESLQTSEIPTLKRDPVTGGCTPLPSAASVLRRCCWGMLGDRHGGLPFLVLLLRASWWSWRVIVHRRGG